MKTSAMIFAAAALSAATTAFAAGNGAFGICEHVTRTSNVGGDYENCDALFGRCAAAGIAWLRTDIDWDYVGGDNGNFSWWRIDNVFASAEAYGVQLLPSLAGANPWTRVAAKDDLDNWEAFVSAFATRYQGRISAVEIWNEPDNENCMWCLADRPDAETAEVRQKLFVELFVKTLKRLKGEFPDIKVGGPALCWWDEPYLRAILDGCKAAGVAPDFISWHYYGSIPEDLIEQAESARRVCDEYGFTDCELVNDEWHFLGEGGFAALRSGDPAVRERVWSGPRSHNGIDSSCFALSVLSRLQTSKYSQAFYYGCRHTGAWGYMDDFGNKYKVWHALKAFGQLMAECATLCESTHDGTVATFAAKSADGKTGWLLVSDYGGTAKEIVVEVKNAGTPVAATILDHERDFAPARVNLDGNRLTLAKELDGSAAFLVKFDRSRL